MITTPGIEVDTRILVTTNSTQTVRLTRLGLIELLVRAGHITQEEAKATFTIEAQGTTHGDVEVLEAPNDTLTIVLVSSKTASL